MSSSRTLISALLCAAVAGTAHAEQPSPQTPPPSSDNAPSRWQPTSPPGAGSQFDQPEPEPEPVPPGPPGPEPSGPAPTPPPAATGQPWTPTGSTQGQPEPAAAPDAGLPPPAAAAQAGAYPQPSTTGGAAGEPAQPEFAPAPPPAAATADTNPIATGAEAGAATAEAVPLAQPQPAADSTTPQDKYFSAAAMLGLGVTFDRTVGGINPLGFGFGVHGDVRLLDELSVGARLLYYVGGSADLPNGEVGMSSWLLAAEGAYVIDFAPVLVMPGLAMGITTRSVTGRPAFIGVGGQSFVPGTQDSTQVGFYVAPGVNVVVPMSIFSEDLEPLFIGGDMRLDLVFGNGVTGNLQLLGQAGVRF